MRRRAVSRRIVIFASLLSLGFLVFTYWNSHRPQSSSSRKILYYQDPMHPTYRSDRPGIAPDCGMPLEPVYQETAEAPYLPGGIGDSDSHQHGLVISNSGQNLVGLTQEVAARKSITRSVNTYGIITVDERHLFRIIAPMDGWIVSAEPLSSGSIVRERQPLCRYYVRELRASMTGLFYILDRQRRQELQASEYTNIDLALETLRGLGMTDAQIEKARDTRQIPADIALEAPATAYVMSQSVSPRQRFRHGDELYVLADLKRLTVEAIVSLADYVHIKPGTKAVVTVPNTGRTFNATVSEIPPKPEVQFSSVRLRLHVENQDLALIPQMPVEVTFPAQTLTGLFVPADAVVDAGTNKRVYVREDDRHFVARTVRVGTRVSDQIEIQSGLTEGDKIVTNGAFLIDSETRLRGLLPANVPAGHHEHRHSR